VLCTSGFVDNMLSHNGANETESDDVISLSSPGGCAVVEFAVLCKPVLRCAGYVEMGTF